MVEVPFITSPDTKATTYLQTYNVTVIIIPVPGSSLKNFVCVYLNSTLSDLGQIPVLHVNTPAMLMCSPSPVITLTNEQSMKNETHGRVKRTEGGPRWKKEGRTRGRWWFDSLHVRVMFI